MIQRRWLRQEMTDYRRLSIKVDARINLLQNSPKVEICVCDILSSTRGHAASSSIVNNKPVTDSTSKSEWNRPPFQVLRLG